MGKEAEVQAIFADGPDHGRLQYEPPKLIFRGATRRVFEGAALEGVRAEGDHLMLADGSRFALGAKQAASWAEAILNPKGRIEKIGVKPGMRTAVIGEIEDAFVQELAGAGAVPVETFSGIDLLFYAADSQDDLAKLGRLAQGLADRGALWVISRKGKAATLKDTDVMAAAKACGLVDNKVVAFSDTHTALRFVRRKN